MFLTRGKTTKSSTVSHGTNFGRVIGCILPQIIKKKGQLRLSNSYYSDCLVNLKVLFQEGMCLVSLIDEDTGDLYVHGPVNDVYDN